VKWVQELFPKSQDYTDVYDHFGLLGPRSIFAHGIYLSDREFQRLQATQSVIAWCPTSNFFLGSGLFQLTKAKKYHNRISIGTDVGGGSSFSMLRTIHEAYKVAAIGNIKFSPLESFYAITLGNAKALSLDDKIGNFETGKEADFIVLNLNSTPLLAYKNTRAITLEEKLFNLNILGDSRTIRATYILGEQKYP
jgi:guanine deaminase